MSNLDELNKSIDEKVESIFHEIAGDRADLILSLFSPSDARGKIAAAMRPEHSKEVADDIAFHMLDWNGDAAFLLALYLFPERFSVNEVRVGITNFLIHAPDHIAAAAKLSGHPINDTFGLGDLLRGEDE